jgi:hypothetical protein
MRLRHLLTILMVAALVTTCDSAIAHADAGGGPVALPAVTGCPVAAWGSLPRSAPGMTPGHIDGVRIGIGPCADRIVFDVAGPTPGWDVRYVSQITADGSGEVIPIPEAGARLLIVIRTNAHDINTGRPTLTSLPDPAQFPVFRGLVLAGDFEGITTVGLGTRARLPFRTFSLPGPLKGHSRIVIDVARSWR